MLASVIRVRFTTRSQEFWNTVLQYAKDTNRTPSELVNEALEQMMARYPKRRHEAKFDLDALADKVATIIAQRYPQVP
jgi:hypothetical protein